MNTESIYTCDNCGSKNTYNEGLLYDWIKPESMFECNDCYDARIDNDFLIMQDSHSLGSF